MVTLFGASPQGQHAGLGQMGYDMGAYQQPGTAYGGVGFGLSGYAGGGGGAGALGGEMGAMSMMGTPMGGMGGMGGMGPGMGGNMMGGGPMGPGAGLGGMGSMSRGLAFGLPQQANGFMGRMGQSGCVLLSPVYPSLSIHLDPPFTLTLHSPPCPVVRWVKGNHTAELGPPYPVSPSMSCSWLLDFISAHSISHSRHTPSGLR